MAPRVTRASLAFLALTQVPQATLAYQASQAHQVSLDLTVYLVSLGRVVSLAPRVTLVREDPDSLAFQVIQALMAS